MSGNNIGPSGATDLANALKVNTTLREIDLAGTLVFGDNAVWLNRVRTGLGDRASACTAFYPTRTLTLSPNLIANPKSNLHGERNCYP